MSLGCLVAVVFFFFLQAEDGIRDLTVTGVQTCALPICMGTAFAGIVRAPMTSVVMIFETTRDYAVIVPLMISNLVSFFISSRLQPQPIYEVLAYQDGIHLPTADRKSTRLNSSHSQISYAVF